MSNIYTFKTETKNSFTNKIFYTFVKPCSYQKYERGKKVDFAGQRPRELNNLEDVQ